MGWRNNASSVYKPSRLAVFKGGSTERGIAVKQRLYVVFKENVHDSANENRVSGVRNGRCFFADDDGLGIAQVGEPVLAVLPMLIGESLVSRDATTEGAAQISLIVA